MDAVEFSADTCKRQLYGKIMLLIYSLKKLNYSNEIIPW